MKRSILMMAIFAAAAFAQAPPDNGLGIGQKMKQNAEALKQYSYKRKTQVSIKGNTRGARVDLVRFVDGKMETVPLETPARSEQSRPRGLRGKMVEKKIEKKKEEMKEDVERLKAVFQQYLAPGSDSMRTMLEKATITRTGPDPNADIKVVTNGQGKSKDSFTLIWSVANKRPAHVEIAAEVDGKPVRINVDFAQLPNGPYYAAHTVISAPKKDLTITMDSFDFTLASETQ